MRRMLTEWNLQFFVIVFSWSIFLKWGNTFGYRCGWIITYLQPSTTYIFSYVYLESLSYIFFTLLSQRVLLWEMWLCIGEIIDTQGIHESNLSKFRPFSILVSDQIFWEIHNKIWKKFRLFYHRGFFQIIQWWTTQNLEPVLEST